MTREEFEENWKYLETPEFVEWFERIFGYDYSRPDEAEYWDQRIYAFMGWKGYKNTHNKEIRDLVISLKSVIEKFEDEEV